MTIHELYERTVHEIRGDTNRDHRKLANNTYGRIEGERVVIRLHDTDIVELTPTSATYNTGGWFTVTTKERINRWMPSYFKVFSDRSIWYVWKFGDDSGKVSRFYDGITLMDHDGVNPVEVLNPRLDDPDEPLRKALDRYVKLYTDERIAELVAHAVTSGTAGDCMYCTMFEPAGHADDDHLLWHIAEGYTMATLMKQAVDKSGYRSDVYLGMFHPDYYTPGVSPRNGWGGNVIRRAIRKYLKARVLNKGYTLPEEDAA